jgi:hypothetical protein
VTPRSLQSADARLRCLHGKGQAAQATVDPADLSQVQPPYLLQSKRG